MKGWLPRRHRKITDGVLPAYFYGGPISLDGDSLATIPCIDIEVWWEWFGHRFRVRRSSRRT